MTIIKLSKTFNKIHPELSGERKIKTDIPMSKVVINLKAMDKNNKLAQSNLQTPRIMIKNGAQMTSSEQIKTETLN